MSDSLRFLPIQELVARWGVRPGLPLGNRFTPANGVQPQPRFDALGPPAPTVVDACGDPSLMRRVNGRGWLL
ncbi:MAG: hypothetical protein Q6L55_09850 [Gloeomargarita sp. SRBZ-1_bins_9]